MTRCVKSMQISFGRWW